MRSSAAAVAAVLIAVTLAACANTSTRTTREPGSTVTATTSAGSLDLRVGDCVGDLDEGSVEDVQLIPCGQEHHWEAFATKDLSGDAYPGATQIQEEAGVFCGDEFEKFVGIAVQESTYDAPYLYPTSETWAAGDREILCFVGLATGGITGSLEDTKE
ncbi:septum formation family protein [Propionicicella superfundia]|uniref:septum formation family protein n=1 Tax=Propionicicella superfundia TaxID=348582 RepID=UPI000423E27D|nr:septum formation family protein [Propionicicella superfundia]